MSLRFEDAPRSKHAPRLRRFAVAFDQLLEAEEGHEEQLKSAGLTAHPCCIISAKDAAAISNTSSSLSPFLPANNTAKRTRRSPK
jgi:hypothetical protein